MKRIFVAGHNGMVGSAICRILKYRDGLELIVRNKNECDLTNQVAVTELFQSEKPDEVIIAAAKVGGIHANNTYPAQFLYENLQIQNNIIHQAHLSNVQKLLFLGSSCIYPKQAAQPISEDSLLTGSLEPTNEPYAIAKIAGIKMCESYNRQYGRDYRSVMPTNLYGPYDNFHAENSHVIAGLIRRFHEAKTNNSEEVYVWGAGTVKRDFMHVNDMAEASLFVMALDHEIYKVNTHPMCSHINIGSGVDITIKALAQTIKQVVGFKGVINFDITKQEGTPRKLMKVDRLSSLGWRFKISLHAGLIDSYKFFINDSNH